MNQQGGWEKVAEEAKGIFHLVLGVVVEIIQHICFALDFYHDHNQPEIKNPNKFHLIKLLIHTSSN